MQRLVLLSADGFQPDVTNILQVADSKDNEELAQKAISIIARERKSEQLNHWCTTGQSGGYEMSPDEALRILGE